MVEGNLLDPALLILHNPAYQLVREYHLDSRYQIFFQPLTHVSASKNAIQLMSSVASCQVNCNIYLLILRICKRLIQEQITKVVNPQSTPCQSLVTIVSVSKILRISLFQLLLESSLLLM